MDSGAPMPAPQLFRTAGTATPPPGPLLIRAPPSLPDENDPTATSSPFSSASSDHEYFLSGEDEPEFETAPRRPFVPVPDQEAAPEEELGGPTESEDSPPSGSNGKQALPSKKQTTMPKARLSFEDDDVADEVFEDGLEGDAEGHSSLPQVVRVAPEPAHPPPGEVVDGPGLVGGGDGVQEEEGAEDDDEKESVAAVEGGTSADIGDSGDMALDGNSNLGVNPDDGVPETEKKETLGDGSAQEVGILGEASEEPISESSVGEQVGKGGMLHENLDADGAAPTESSYPMGLGDEATAAVPEDDLALDAGEGKHVDLSAGEEEERLPVAAVIGNSEAMEVQSSFLVDNGADGDESFNGECENGKLLGGDAGEGKNSVAEVAAESSPDGAEAEVAVEESGTQCGTDADTVSSVTNITQEDQSSEMKENIGLTEVEETFDSSETKDGVEEVEKGEPVKVVSVSENSGEAEHSVQGASDLDNGGIIEGFLLETKDGGNEIEPASAELRENFKNGKPVLDAHECDLSSSGVDGSPSFLNKVSNTDQLDNQASVISDVVSYGNALVNSSAKSDQVTKDSDDGDNIDLNEGSEEDDVVTDGFARTALLENYQAAKHITKEMGEGSAGRGSGFGNSHDYSDQIDGEIVSDSEEEVMTDDEGNGKELFDSAVLNALLKAATGGSSDSGITTTAPDGTRIFSLERPAGLGSSVPSLKPAPSRVNRPNIFSPSDLSVVGEPENNMDEEEKKLQEKVEQIRVKFLRLVHRLGHSPEDRVAAQVLYRLGLAEGIRHGRQFGRAFSLENAKKKALQLEEEGKEPLDFSCNILILGKTGVGKSATINSIFGEEKVSTSAFDPATMSVKEITGTVDGVKVCVMDTPGLKPSVMDQIMNKRILSSIKKYTKKCPPDIVLYVDRLDTHTWDFNDLPLLRSVVSTMGSSIWFNAIVALTHAASAPPDGPSGSPLSYEVFVDQRSRVVQHAIRQAAGDMRLMNPVALVENHPSCRRNREDQQVLPNGLSWRSQMLLLCYSSKILSEANSVLKLQDPSPGKLFGFRVRSPPLPYLLSSLLQSRVHPKLATDQGGEDGDSDIDLGNLSDSDQEQEEDEYDLLPPFKPLRKAQIAKLTKEQRNAYFEEYDYRVKLLQKKQWKEEVRRSKEMKMRGKAVQDESGYGDMVDDYDQDSSPATIPVPLPDMILPPSFDCDNPVYRYRFLEPKSQLIARPVLDSHGWDHDCGYDGVSLEESLPIARKFPAGISVQVTKDKKEFSIHMDSSISAKHGEIGSSLTGFDIQTIGKQLAYILRGETKFKNLKKNKTAAGISVTFLGENIATGLKVEDQLLIGKRLGLVASGGAIRAQGDMAYGANLEVRLRGKDFPIDQDVSTLGLSLMRWRRDLALGANLQSQFSVGRKSKMAVRFGLNNKHSGQITVRTSTSEQLQIALLGILPIAISVYRSIWSGESD